MCLQGCETRQQISRLLQRRVAGPAGGPPLSGLGRGFPGAGGALQGFRRSSVGGFVGIWEERCFCIGLEIDRPTDRPTYLSNLSRPVTQFEIFLKEDRTVISPRQKREKDRCLFSLTPTQHSLIPSPHDNSFPLESTRRSAGSQVN